MDKFHFSPTNFFRETCCRHRTQPGISGISEVDLKRPMGSQPQISSKPLNPASLEFGGLRLAARCSERSAEKFGPHF